MSREKFIEDMIFEIKLLEVRIVEWAMKGFSTVGLETKMKELTDKLLTQ